MYLYNSTDQYETLPERIILPDGMTRTSLHELSKEQQESLGLVEYETITPAFDSLLQQWDNSYTFDHSLKTAAKNIIDRNPDVIKADKLSALLQDQKVIQDTGMICSNNIKLQVDETSLIRWTQLMVGLSAFQPPTVSIRDFDNVVHEVSLSVASQMLAEVFIWGQTFLAETWTKKDAINAG